MAFGTNVLAISALSIFRSNGCSLFVFSLFTRFEIDYKYFKLARRFDVIYGYVSLNKTAGITLEKERRKRKSVHSVMHRNTGVWFSENKFNCEESGLF